MTKAKPKPETPTTAWPASKVVVRPLTELTPRANNSRTHSASQIDKLAALMLAHGWTTAVLVDEGGVLLAGHGRILAAAQLLEQGHEQFSQVPVMEAVGWSEAAKRAYVIADNQVASLAGWDQAILGAELKDLAGLGVDMSLIGFDAVDLRSLMRGASKQAVDPDAVPPLEKVAVSVLGDQWVLGDHVIRCGSSTDPKDVEALLSGRTPHLMVTDPPYGVNYDPTWRTKATGQKVRAIGKVLNDDKADWREAWDLFPGAVAYVWHGALHSGTVQASLESTGFEMRAQIIWAKDRLILSRGHYHWKHEPCWYAVRTGKTAQWSGGRKQNTLWEIPLTVDDGSTGHGTQKPVECMRRPIENNSKPGDWVYEPFSGSGSTIIAGEQSGRRVLAMELNPPYVDLACRRYQAFSGTPVVHAVTGKTFEETMAERAEAA